MMVSVIIPAYNAAATLGETLQSLQAQTFDQWEAVIIDDGSVDETASIAAGFAQKDVRIRVFSQPNAGVSAARNAGMNLTNFDWLYFLDADDLVLPSLLKSLTDRLDTDPGLDAAYCGWARLAPDGTCVHVNCWYQSGQVFNTMAHDSPFPINACLVRRSAVNGVGGWDTSLRTCEDWDLWQRVARTGARFGTVKEVLALYRMSLNSASLDGQQMLTDGLRVLKQGHSPDPRVSNALPAYMNGLPAEQLLSQKFYYLCWCASLAIGCGRDARPMLDALREYTCPQLDPYVVAHNIFHVVVLPTCRMPESWVELWPNFSKPIDEFLLALEDHTQARGLRLTALAALDRLILEHSHHWQPVIRGVTLGLRQDIAQPIPDLHTTSSVERLCYRVDYDGEPLGTMTLPMFDGFIPAYVLADTVAAEFTWKIIDRFFQKVVYCGFEFRKEQNSTSVWRGSICLAAGLREDEGTLFENLLHQAGWLIFLQELWARPYWPLARFYDQGFLEETRFLWIANDDWLTVEIGQELPSVKTPLQHLNVVISVGGVAIGAITMPVEQNFLSAQQLRVAITREGGFELCRAAVREGLLGRSISDSVSLQDRLAEAAAKRRALGHQDSGKYCSELTPSECGGASAPSLFPGDRTVLLGRRAPGDMDTSLSRRAMLPAALVSELLESAKVAGEPAIKSLHGVDKPERVIYAPDLIFRPEKDEDLSVLNVEGPREIRQANDAVYGRRYFEDTFAAGPDPWKYTSPYEQKKYEQTLAMLPKARIGRTLELGCAEGHFTIQLAHRVGKLVAADISQIALERAAKRCADYGNVSFARLDLTRDKLPGRFNLIVCSEVLYYVGGKEKLADVAQRLAAALKLGGHMLVAHANLVVDETDRTGFDWPFPLGAKVIGETLSGTAHLHLVKELRTPLYRIQLFRRDRILPFSLRRRSPRLIHEQHAVPVPDVAKNIRWEGGEPIECARVGDAVTDRLPILMYHRVAPAGLAATARYRVTPDAFEEQLCYLRDAGYYSVTLEDWRAAMQVHAPLPSRAVLITFDDGYLDFMTYAWPLLKQYGFSASVFLVAGEVGRSNAWDSKFGEEVPLLTWDQIRRLQQEGVRFGAHSASHPCLTTLSPAAIVREAIISRTILEKELGIPVRSFAYPFGGEDSVVRHLIGACGYIYGLTCRWGRSGLWDPLLSLPRIEILGSDSFETFIKKMGC